MHGTRMIIVDAGQTTGAEQLKAQLAACGAQVAHSFRLIPGVAAGMTPEALRKFFAQYPNAKVMPDRRRQLPPMPFGRDEWKEVAGPAAEPGTKPDQPEISPLAVELMKADQVHKLGIDGAGVRVCIIDSGVEFSHPDLYGTALVDADGKPLAADFTETDLTDTLGHGTAVAGCVAAQGRQTYTIVDEQSGKPSAYTKILGIAPGVRLMSAKVFDTRVPAGYDSSIIAALEWAADNGAHIVNMSLGGVSMPNDGNDPLARAVTALRERGILVIVSAGNEGAGFGTLKSPGSAHGALTVGASTMYRSFAELGFLAKPGKWTADQLAAFSSLGPSADGRLKPEILAPGAFDWGLAPTAGSEEGQSFQLFGGTSQAAPLMTGAAALVCQAFHKARGRYPTPDELVSIVLSTADDFGLPAHMQGAGRVNCLRAVQAAQGQAKALMVSMPAPAVVSPGQEATVKLNLTNAGADSAPYAVTARQFERARGISSAFHGEIATTQTPQEMHFNVAPGTDLMQVSLDWPSEEHTPDSPRLMLALYDPKGNFVNYQRPNGSGDMELGKSVDCWVARPATGRWTAQITLRLGKRDTVQPFTLNVRAYKHTAWSWVAGAPGGQSLAAGETREISLNVRVPEGTQAGTYSGHIMVGSTAVPLSVVVPIALEQGQGTFAGEFQHGYQGSWGNGDWLYHDLPVPAGTKSLIASLQWPDVDNALEFYLVDPTGNAVMGRSNSADVADDGDSDQLGSQILLANPMPGTWRLALHSFAFCGRGMPEPYSGVVETAGHLVSPSQINLRVNPGDQVPIALLVRNPGRLPLTVEAIAQSAEPRLTWQALQAELKAGVTPEGKPLGDGHLAMTAIHVPHGATELGVCLTWEKPANAEVTLSLYDPVSQADRATASSKAGHVMALENNPVPGEWTVMAGTINPESGEMIVPVKGAVFVVAPQVYTTVAAGTVTVQPGGEGILPVTLALPEGATSLAGRLVVTTTRGDRLGEIEFQVETIHEGGADAEVAATKR